MLEGAGPSPSPGVSWASTSASHLLNTLPSYQKWKQKQKIDDRDSEEEGPSDRRGPERRGWKRGRGQGRMHRHMHIGKRYVWSPGNLVLRSLPSPSAGDRVFNALSARACAA